MRTCIEWHITRDKHIKRPYFILPNASQESLFDFFLKTPTLKPREGIETKYANQMTVEERGMLPRSNS